MDKAIESLEQAIHKLKWSVAKLEEENAKLREALEFYASLSNWRFTDRFDYPYYETLEGDVSYHDGKFFAGQKARAALEGGE